jgi:hypothetical protein
MIRKLIEYIKIKLALRKRLKEVRKNDPYIYK